MLDALFSFFDFYFDPIIGTLFLGFPVIAGVFFYKYNQNIESNSEILIKNYQKKKKLEEFKLSNGKENEFKNFLKDSKLNSFLSDLEDFCTMGNFYENFLFTEPHINVFLSLMDKFISLNFGEIYLTKKLNSINSNDCLVLLNFFESLEFLVVNNDYTSIALLKEKILKLSVDEQITFFKFLSSFVK